MCDFGVYPYLIVKNFQYQIKGIFVIMKNYKSLFAKSFDLESIFNLVKSFFANVLVIITWQLYCNLIQNLLYFAIKKSFS
jgi:hypothetical protein